MHSQFAEQPLDEGQPRRRFPIVIPRQHQLSGQDVVRLKAGRDGEDALQTSPEQAGADQQDERQRHLPDDERVAQPLRRATHRAPAGFRLQHERELAAQVEPQHGQRERDAGESRRDQRHQGHPSAQGDIRTQR